MASRTERVLWSLGSPEAFAVVTALLVADMTQTALKKQTKLATRSLHHTLQVLSQAGLVERLPGTQGPWHLTHWVETRGVLRAARALSVALAGTDDHSADAERELLDGLDEAGAARRAAKRGRPRDDGR